MTPNPRDPAARGGGRGGMRGGGRGGYGGSPWMDCGKHLFRPETALIGMSVY